MLATFRPRDRKRVELSHDVTFPLRVRHYFTWTFGRRVFLVFASPGDAPKGIVFDAAGEGPAVPHMCDWCQQVGLGARVGMLTARRDRKSTIGILVCADLGCRERLEDLSDRHGLELEPTMRKVLERMERFAERLGFEEEGP